MSLIIIWLLGSIVLLTAGLLEYFNPGHPGLQGWVVMGGFLALQSLAVLAVMFGKRPED